jgi:hypothetical protein
VGKKQLYQVFLDILAAILNIISINHAAHYFKDNAVTLAEQLIPKFGVDWRLGYIKRAALGGALKKPERFLIGFV